MKHCQWGDVCILDYGKGLRNYPADPFDTECYRVFGTNGAIGWTKEPLYREAGIIVGRKGAYRGIHFSADPFFVIDTAYGLRLKSEEIDLKWAYYKLLTVDMNRMDVGAAIPTTNRDQFYSMPLDYPTLIQQQKVAGTLSTYDDLIQNNRRRMALLEESARLLYQEWFVRLRFPGYEHTSIVNGVPEGWEKVKMKHVCASVGGGTPSTSNPAYWEDGNITWITPTDITRNNCLVLLDSAKKITESGLKNSSAKMLPPETILMTSRASLCFFGLVGHEVCTNQGFIAVIPNHEHLRMYILHNLMSRRDEIIGKAGGTTYKEINKSTFREMEILVPGRVLLEDFNAFAYDTVRQTRVLKKQATKLIGGRDLLLPRLMSGEIVV